MMCFCTIRNWFLNELPKLPKKDLNTILDELMEKDHHESEIPDKLIYPEDVPLPRMKNILPASGFSWKMLYMKYSEFLKKLIKS